MPSNKTCFTEQADVRGANNLLIKELYTVLGDSILSGNPRLPERQLTRLKEVRDCRDVTAALACYSRKDIEHTGGCAQIRHPPTLQV